ncbi:hypothetical protein GCM10017688_28030 [Streptomyces ramulosus]
MSGAYGSAPTAPEYDGAPTTPKGFTKTEAAGGKGSARRRAPSRAYAGRRKPIVGTARAGGVQRPGAGSTASRKA